MKLSRTDLLLAAGLSLLVFGALLVQFGQLFPLTEYRDWRPDLLPQSSSSFLWQGFTRQIAFARSLAFVQAVATASACGPATFCQNVPVLLPVAVTVGLFVLLARRLGAAMPLAAAGALYWVAAAPAVSALAWQATIFDRMALLWSLAALLAYLHFTAARLDGRRLLACNIVVFVLTAFALMSKEVAFPLPAILLLFGWFELDQAATRRARLQRLALPTIYAAYVWLTYLRDYTGIASAWRGHVLEGDPGANLVFYLSQLLPFATSPVVAIGGGVTLLALLGVACWRVRRDGRPGVVRVALLLLAAAAIFTVPVLRVRYQNGYYLYLPHAFLALAYVVLASALVRGRRVAGVVALVPLVLLALLFWAGPARGYLHELRASDNFRRSFEQLRALQPAGQDVLVTVLTPTDFPPHLFVDGGLRNLWLYIDPAVAAGIDAANRPVLVFGDTCPSTPWRYCLRYDADMNLREAPIVSPPAATP